VGPERGELSLSSPARAELLDSEPARLPVTGGMLLDIAPGLAPLPSESVSLYFAAPYIAGEVRE